VIIDKPILQIGCGAIGCEMLKNYALLGIGSNGKVRSHLHQILCIHLLEDKPHTMMVPRLHKIIHLKYMCTCKNIC
jgi:molybdopterin/thiamine biosynthesis adenylyltransferase